MFDPRRQRLMGLIEAAELNPDEQPGEVEAGRWIPVTRSTWRHGKVVGNVYACLRSYAKAHPGWSVSVGDPGVKLSHDPDTLRGPDVAMVRADREPTGRGIDGWLEGAPDLAVEVMGDAQSTSEMVRKALEYLAAGSRLVWVLDLEPERVLIFTPPDHVLVVGSGGLVDGGELLPQFTCSVEDFFE